MFGYIIGISLFIIAVLIIIFIFCSCILASRADRLAEKMFSEKNIKNTY